MGFKKQFFKIKTPINAMKFLQDLGFKQNKAQKIIDKKRLFCNENFVTKTSILQGDVYLYKFTPEKLENEILLISKSNFCNFSTPDPIFCEFLSPIFENDLFCAFNKPPNLLSHPKGRFSHVSLCDSMIFHFGIEASLAHRLDFETSGIVICTKTKELDSKLKDAIFYAEKTYLAWVDGEISQNLILDFDIKTPKKLQKTKNLGIRSEVSNNGKKALTLVYPIKSKKLLNKTITLVKIIPKTGRTHQIRLHLAYINHPIIGEKLYSSNQEAGIYLEQKRLFLNSIKSRLWLHASEIKFNLFGKSYCFEV